MAIGKRFTNGLTAKNVRTVGELIKELSQFDSRTPVRMDGADSCDVVLFNAKLSSAHIAFAEGGMWDEVENDNEH